MMKYISIPLLLVLLIMIYAGQPLGRMDVTRHIYKTAKMRTSLRICILADLHCRRFGRRQSMIIRNVRREQPDLVVIPGDLFDVDRDYEIAFELIEELRHLNLTVCFTSGNHDMYLHEIDELRNRLRRMGVFVLEDRSHIFMVNDQKIRVTGLTDHGRQPVYTAQRVEDMQGDEECHYDIVLCHRPNHTEYFGTLPCDLVISGHAHGGQWRTPFRHRPLYAPQEGFFPKHTEGLIEVNGVKCCVSRGLASGHPDLPRMFNNPEIVMINIGGISL